MHRKLSICAALAAVAVFAHAMPTSAPTPAAADCENVFAVEPLVIFDVSGYSLGGAIHQHLAVYNNGLASISSASGIPSAVAGGSTFKFLPASEAFQLARDLYQAGAWNICDELVPVSDIPLTTITVLRGATNAPSHTYSYFVPGSPEAQAAAVILEAFVDEHFPGF